MVNIIEKKSDITLRIIDFFVSVYSKIYGIKYKLIDSANTYYYFDVYSSYKKNIKHYKKIYFDPFRRKCHVTINYDNENKLLVTTVGQMNFFRWAMQNYVIEYIENNLTSIQKMGNVVQNNIQKMGNVVQNNIQKTHALPNESINKPLKQNTICPISLETISMYYSICDNCNNKFNYESINQWINKHHNCPMCRIHWDTFVKYINI